MKELIVKTSLAGMLLLGTGYYIYDEHQDQAKVEQLQERYTTEINQLKKELKDQKKQYDVLNVKLEKSKEETKTENKKFELAQNKIDILNEKLKASEKKYNELKKEYPRGVTTSSGNTAVRSVNVTATGYISYCAEGCTGKTATGLDVSSSITYKGARIIAVDPSIIPLYSYVKVHPKNGSPFYAYAMDTGGAINGHKIDVLISPSDTQAARDFGKQQNVRIDIIKEGK